MFPKLKNEHFILRTVPVFAQDIMRYKSIFDCLQQYYGREDINISFTKDSFEKKIESYTNGRLGSTGFNAIILFARLFDCVDIYGFDHHLASDTVQYYFLQTSIKLGQSSSTHNFSVEKDVCSKLERLGKLRRHV